MSTEMSFLGPGADIEDELRLRISASILHHGHTVISVGSGRCSHPGCDCEPIPVPWSYTIGFTARDHPEIVAFGLNERCGCHLMDSLYQRIDRGDPLPVGEVVNLDGHIVKLAPAPVEWLAHDPGRMGTWMEHHLAGCNSVRLPDVLQLLWADYDGWFPDDDSCDPEVAALQPVLANDPYSYPPVD